MALTNDHFRQVIAIVPIRLHKLEVEHLSQHRELDLYNLLGKGLSEADSLASIERQPGENAALFALRSASQGIRGIKTIR